MIIYILHNDRYYTFRLPKNIAGNHVLFDYDKDSIKRNLANIVGEKSKWILKSNSNARIVVNKEYVESVELNLYTFYLITTTYNENIFIYVSPGNDTSFVAKRINSNNPVRVGTDLACDVVLVDQIVAKEQFSLQKVDESIVYKTIVDTPFLYVNGRKYSEKVLNDFDMIFLNGYIFLVLSDIVFISNKNTVIQFGQASLIDLRLEYAVKTIDKASVNYADFYDSANYFTKSPVFRKKTSTLSVTITSPEEKETKTDSSFVMALVPSALMSVTSLLSAYFSLKNFRQGVGDKENLITTLLTAAIMIFVSVAWPFIERFAESIRRIINNVNRNIKYKKYLKKKRDTLEQARTEQKATLQFNNLSLEECQEVIINKNANLFSYNPEQSTFLNVKLGVGKVKMDCEFDYTKPDYVKVKDKLLNDIDQLIEDYKYIVDAPYSFSLVNNVAFIYGKNNYESYLESIILQILTFHDYFNLKIVIFTTENTFLSKIRNLNHCWNNDRTMRFYASNLQEGDTLSSYLVRIFNSRTIAEEKKESTIPHYLVVCDNMDLYRNLTIIDKILRQKDQKTGFSFMTFAERITDVPDCCSYFVDYQSDKSTLFQSEMDESNIMSFNPELSIPKINTSKCIELISNIPIKNNVEANAILPDKLGFLEMNNVGTVEQLNSINRWKNSQIVNTLAAPIGVDANGNILMLDLHEKAHGPHGLIAGMTGSGKSEFIVTYILSMAVNYSPDEVQFVLIDYKGGGLAGAFENKKTGVKLPHLVGTITNLDKAEMNRTLVSIKSELERRQRVFNEAKEQLNTGTIDIYKYQKLVREGSLTEPMSHLYIICDEFAELKAQQPEFMDELVSAARIGRSLGIHLILATQKPSGVVDDQIWSNSKFKVCCKVQTTDDSKEMIRREDAAYIKESGRFYLQVGYDEIFIKGQSAYTGTQYVPSETIVTNDISKTDIDFIDDLGNITNTIKTEKEKVINKEDLGDELGNVLNYLVTCAKEIGYTNKKLWLDNVPTTLYYNNVIKKYNIKPKLALIEATIGEYDDPRNQKQGPVTLDLSFGGNLYITGIAGSGKTTMLSTITYSLITSHNVNEVNIYIIDLGAETLKRFSMAPQIGDVLTIGDKERVSKLFYYLQREMEKRKNYYTSNGGNFEGDIKSGKNTFPTIIVMINGYDVFKEQFESLDEDVMSSFTRECNRYGITVIITAVTTNLGYAIESNFKSKVTLQLSDSTDYNILLAAPTGMVPNSNPGRGLINVNEVTYEYQTSLIFDYASMDTNLTYIIEQLQKALPNKAPRIPDVPNKVTISTFKNEMISLTALPIGIDLKSACPTYYNFDHTINIITYGKEISIKGFVPALLTLFSYLNNVKNIVLSAYDFLKIDNEKIKMYNSGFTSVLPALYKNIEKTLNDTENKNKYIITIFGYSKLKKHLNKLKNGNSDSDDEEDEEDEEETEKLEEENVVEEVDENIVDIDDIIMLAKKSNRIRFLIIENMNFLANVDNYEWYHLFDSRNGILVAGEFDDQELFMAETDYDRPNVGRDNAVVIKNGSKEYVKFVSLE